jgi:polyphosphate glucokinase
MEEINQKILAIDIGGSHIKASILNGNGVFLQKYEREETPKPPSPSRILNLIATISKRFPEYDKLAAGFAGYVKGGIVKTVPRLGTDLWQNYDLAKSLEIVLGKPALVINDADLQGLALASGKGIEMIITLGTGFGSAIMRDGILLPHIEMSQHPVTKNKNYNDYVGEEALQKIGKKKWNKRMKKIICILKTVFNYDHLYISGGNAQLITFKLDKNVSIYNNKDGIKGGAFFWNQNKNDLDEKITAQLIEGH